MSSFQKKNGKILIIKVGSLYKINILTLLWGESGKHSIRLSCVLNIGDIFLLLEIKDATWGEAKKEYRVLTENGITGWVIGNNHFSNVLENKRSFKLIKKVCHET
jgi:hypothetical protein